jgi:hypothetical protein
MCLLMKLQKLRNSSYGQQSDLSAGLYPNRTVAELVIEYPYDRQIGWLAAVIYDPRADYFQTQQFDSLLSSRNSTTGFLDERKDFRSRGNALRGVREHYNNI